MCAYSTRFILNALGIYDAPIARFTRRRSTSRDLVYVSLPRSIQTLFIVYYFNQLETGRGSREDGVSRAARIERRVARSRGASDAATATTTVMDYPRLRETCACVCVSRRYRKLRHDLDEFISPVDFYALNKCSDLQYTVERR